MGEKYYCFLCGNKVPKDQYFLHLEKKHSIEVDEFLFEIERMIPNPELDYELKNLKIAEDVQKYELKNNFEPDEFKMEATTIWSFPKRGKWATHNGKYRGNWSPYVPRNIILRYSKEGDWVLDQFVGSGTTMIEARLLRRRGIGVDINPDALKIASDNLKFDLNSEYYPQLHFGDARNLDFIEDESIDLICTHPPYANIIRYSNDENDLSNYGIDNFLFEMKKVAKESLRVLKKDKYCAILIGDTRKNKRIVPLGFKVMQEFINAGFLLKEIIIKEQHNCRATGFWYKRSIEFNFLLIAHEYLLVFEKPK